MGELKGEVVNLDSNSQEQLGLQLKDKSNEDMRIKIFII